MYLRRFISLCVVASYAAALFLSSPGFAQEEAAEKKYYLGTEQELMIRVHIWGEVHTPGEYLVPDGTTVLDLISKAGGPTEYASLHKVRITHAVARSPRHLILDLKAYLEKDDYGPPPVLLPGDVVQVPWNRWYRWTRLSRIASHLTTMVSIVYSVWWMMEQVRK